MSPTWIEKASGSRSMCAIIATKRGSCARLYGVSPITPKEKPPGTGGPSAQDAQASPAAAARLLARIGELAQPIERLQRFARRELVGLERAQRLGERIGRGRRAGGPFRARGEQVGLRAAGAQLRFEPREVLARYPHHVLRDAGEVRHVDAVGAVRGAAFHA